MHTLLPPEFVSDTDISSIAEEGNGSLHISAVSSSSCCREAPSVIRVIPLLSCRNNTWPDLCLSSLPAELREILNLVVFEVPRNQRLLHNN